MLNLGMDKALKYASLILPPRGHLKVLVAGS